MAGLISVDYEKLSSFELFKGLNRSFVEKIAFGAVTKNLKHREFFFRAGDTAQSFCIVLDGAIKLLRHSPRGEDIIMHFAVQGDVVGALLMNQSESAIYFPQNPWAPLELFVFQSQLLSNIGSLTSIYKVG